MEGILLHVLYRGEKANVFASEMERSGLRAAVQIGRASCRERV